MDPTFLILIALLVAVMFFMSSRTRKQQRAQQEFRSSLGAGKEVMTASGMVGTVVEVDTESGTVTIESASGARTEWVLAAVNERPARYSAPASEDTDDDEAADVTEQAGTADTITPDVIDVPDDLSGLDDSSRDRKDRRDGETDAK